MSKKVNEVCCCNVKVAVGDPSRVEVDGRVYHASCLKRTRKLNVQVQVHQHEQLAFKFSVN